MKMKYMQQIKCFAETRSVKCCWLHLQINGSFQWKQTDLSWVCEVEIESAIGAQNPHTHIQIPNKFV